MLIIEPIGAIQQLGDQMTDDEFAQFCSANPHLRIERNQYRHLIIMPPTHSDPGFYEAEVLCELRNWNKQHRTGIVFSPSSGFALPNGAIRTADAAWLSLPQWHSLSPQQQQSFAPIAPEFVIEVRAKTDRLAELQAKMLEWIDNGVLLAWLIDPTEQQVFIYRADGTTEYLSNFDTPLHGEDLLPHFTLDLQLLQLP